jgi:hypothetical protein
MRRTSALTLLMLCLIPAGRAGAATPTATQATRGLMVGEYTAAEGRLLESDGTYSTGGQLGSGHYEIDALGNGGEALHLLRNDGMRLDGESSCCTSDVILAMHGTRDVVSARLTLDEVKRVIDDQLSSLPHHEEGTAVFTISGPITMSRRIGYWMLDVRGRVYPFGGFNAFGNAPTSSAVHLEPAPSRLGYWIVDAGGHVFSFGDARWHGNGDALSRGERVVTLMSSATGDGYWIVTSRGRVFARGDARALGDAHAVRLQGPIVGAAVTPSGRGYWLAGSDGGVFGYGDARFYGSASGVHAGRPVVAFVATTDGRGYWMFTATGATSWFGDAHVDDWRGSLVGTRLNRPIVAAVRSGDGYLLIGGDGGMFSFSDDPVFGNLVDWPIPAPISAAAATG